MSPPPAENDFATDVYAYSEASADEETLLSPLRSPPAGGDVVAEQLLAAALDEARPAGRALSSSADLLVVPSGRQLSLLCSSVVAFRRGDAAREALARQSAGVAPHSDGSVTLTDSSGAVLWLCCFASPAALDAASDLMSARYQADVCAACAMAVAREVVFAKRFHLQPGAAAALVVTLTAKEGLGGEMLELFEQFAVPGLLSEVHAWRGAIFATHVYTNEVLLVSFYESQAAMDDVIAQGFIQAQMLNFRSLLTDVPTVRKFAVHNNSFTTAPVSGGLRGSFESLSVRRQKEALALERMTQQVLNNTAQLASKSGIVYKAPPRIGHTKEEKPPPSPPVHLADHPRRHLATTLAGSRGHSKAPRVIHADKEKGLIAMLRQYGVPRSEKLVRSFFTNSMDTHGSGQLHVTTSYLVFDRRNVNSRRLVLIAMKNIMQLRKGKQTRLPTKGHSLRMWTRSGNVHRFKGVWHRDELVDLLLQQTALLQPSHNIEVLAP